MIITEYGDNVIEFSNVRKLSMPRRTIEESLYFEDGIIEVSITERNPYDYRQNSLELTPQETLKLYKTMKAYYKSKETN